MFTRIRCSRRDIATTFSGEHHMVSKTEDRTIRIEGARYISRLFSHGTGNGLGLLMKSTHFYAVFLTPEA